MRNKSNILMLYFYFRAFQEMFKHRVRQVKSDSERDMGGIVHS